MFVYWVSETNQPAKEIGGNLRSPLQTVPQDRLEAESRERDLDRFIKILHSNTIMWFSPCLRVFQQGPTLLLDPFRHYEIRFGWENTTHVKFSD